LDLDLAASWCIGDRISDVNAAAGIGGRAVLVLTGDGEKHAEDAAKRGIPVVGDLRAAAELILAVSHKP
jgi:phosphoglycolate phosphatase-like HAD superfamily hydrolase